MKMRATLGLMALACAAPQVHASASTVPDDACKSLKSVLRASLENILSIPRKNPQELAVLVGAYYTPEERLLLDEASPEERQVLLQTALARRTPRIERVDGSERRLLHVTHLPRTTPVNRDPQRTYMDELMIDADECPRDFVCRVLLKRERGRRSERKFDFVASDYWIEFPHRQNRLEVRKNLNAGEIDQQALDALPIASPETASLKDRRLRLSALRVSLHATTLAPTLWVEGMIEGLAKEAPDSESAQRGHAVGGTLDELIRQAYLPEECRK